MVAQPGLFINILILTFHQAYAIINDMEKENRRTSPEKIITEAFASNEFLEVGASNHRKMGEKAIGIFTLGEVIYRISKRKTIENKGYDTPESLQFKLAALLPSFISSQRKLDSKRDSLNKTEKAKALEDVIGINHIVRELIESETYDTVNQLTQFAGNYFRSIGQSAAVINYAGEKMREVVQGMRHEIAAQSVLNNIPGVEDVTECTSAEDERRGRDVRVTYKGISFFFDIKASERGANDANKKKQAYNFDDSIAIWSGFSWDDFGNKLIPPSDVLGEKESYFVELLDGLVEDGYGQELIAS